MAVKSNWAAGDKVNASDLNQNFKECGPFGSYESKSANTVYQADTDGLLIGVWPRDTSGIIQCDGSNPPTTTILTVRAYSTGNDRTHVCLPIKRGNYYKAQTYFEELYWIPIGTA